MEKLMAQEEENEEGDKEFYEQDFWADAEGDDEFVRQSGESEESTSDSDISDEDAGARMRGERGRGARTRPPPDMRVIAACEARRTCPPCEAPKR